MGVATVCEPITEPFIYFERNDHGVAEKTRDENIALRGQKDGFGPRIFICEGLPHAFCLSVFPFLEVHERFLTSCIEYNDIMVCKVAGIREIRNS